MSNVTRPEELRYAFNDKIKLSISFMLALQQIIPMGASLILPAMLLREANASVIVSASMMSAVLLAIAITTLLQAQRGKLFGAGMFLPLSATPNILAQSIIAVKMGGLSLLFGMTIFAGVVQAMLSFVTKHIHKYFPPEIAGMVLVLLGIDLGMIGLRELFDYHQMQMALPFHLSHTVIEFLPLILIVSFSIWGNTFLKTYGVFIAVVIAYVATYATGMLDPATINALKTSRWLFLPEIAPAGYHFSSELMIPFIIAALVNTVKVSGGVSGLQELQDAHYTTPDISQITRANFTDSIGSCLAGLLGGMGTNLSSRGIAISLSNQITSRYLAYPFVFVIFIMAFCPRLILLFVFMPMPISGAVIFCLGASLLGNSLKMTLKYIHRFEQHVCIGISFCLGLSHDVYPDIFIQLPSHIKSLTGSSIALATICAVLLNFLLNLKHHFFTTKHE